MSKNTELKMVKNAICGLNKDMSLKALVIMTTQTYDAEDMTSGSEPVMEHEAVKPIVQIGVNGLYTYVDLIFPSENDPDLAQFYRCVERYHELIIDDESPRFPANLLSIIPLSMGGQYYMSFIIPVFWSILPDRVGGEYRKLRLVYNKNMVTVSKDDINEDQMDEKINRSLNRTVYQSDDAELLDSENTDDNAGDNEKYIQITKDSVPSVDEIAEDEDEDDEDKYYKGGTYD